MKKDIHPDYGPVVFRDVFVPEGTPGREDPRHGRSGREVQPPLQPSGSGVVKVRSSLRSLAKKDGSIVVKRRGRLYVINKKNPRWKGRQG